MEKNNCGQYSGRKRLQFCVQRDPLGKRMIFHKNFKHFYKKRKKLAPPKVKNYVWSRSNIFDFFDLKIFRCVFLCFGWNILFEFFIKLFKIFTKNYSFDERVTLSTKLKTFATGILSGIFLSIQVSHIKPVLWGWPCAGLVKSYLGRSQTETNALVPRQRLRRFITTRLEKLH